MDQRRHDARERARELARTSLERGDATGWFEALYREAAGDTGRIPWADAEGHPLLVEWLASQSAPASGARALVVGCGLGEDSECLSRAGWNVTAFDVSPTAIDWCRKLHPHSSVRYTVGDLLDPPSEWLGQFALVFECYTLQALPAALRERASASLARLVAPGGSLLVVTRAREPGEDPGTLPWPLLRSELARFTTLGLVEREFDERESSQGLGPTRHFRARYTRH
ncbi:MAG: methyltransferase domain-containing protein [Planctomycetaceae bacterium]|nr:methyltransferase domain-containing protein [Planctomycetaceae bacterium]